MNRSASTTVPGDRITRLPPIAAVPSGRNGAAALRPGIATGLRLDRTRFRRSRQGHDPVAAEHRMSSAGSPVRTHKRTMNREFVIASFLFRRGTA